MNIYDDDGEGSFSDGFLPNLSELESSIKKTLGFKPDVVEKISHWLETREDLPEPEDFAECASMIEKHKEYLPPQLTGDGRITVDHLLIFLYIAAKNVKKSADGLDRILKNSPNDVEMLVACAEGCLYMESYELAQKVCKKLLEIHPTNFEINLNLVLAFYYNGQYKEAKAQAMKCFHYIDGDSERKNKWSIVYYASKAKLGEEIPAGNPEEAEQARFNSFFDDLLGV